MSDQPKRRLVKPGEASPDPENAPLDPASQTIVDQFTQKARDAWKVDPRRLTALVELEAQERWQASPVGRGWARLEQVLKEAFGDPVIAASPPVQSAVAIMYDLVAEAAGWAISPDSVFRPLADHFGKSDLRQRGRKGGRAPKNPHRVEALKLFDELRPAKPSNNAAIQSVVAKLSERFSDAPTAVSVANWVRARKL